MKTYKVSIERLTQKRAQVLVEAKNEKEAIELARKIEWEDFDEMEELNTTQWHVKRNRNLLDFLLGSW